ncbi:hypothetical protein ACJX0J_029075 [Zea mays]
MYCVLQFTLCIFIRKKIDLDLSIILSASILHLILLMHRYISLLGGHPSPLVTTLHDIHIHVVSMIIFVIDAIIQKNSKKHRLSGGREFLQWIKFFMVEFKRIVRNVENIDGGGF